MTTLQFFQSIKVLALWANLFMNIKKMYFGEYHFVWNCFERPSWIVPDGSVEGPQTANLDCTVLHPNCNLCNPIAIFFNRIYTATLRKSCSIFSQFTWVSLLSCGTYFNVLRYILFYVFNIYVNEILRTYIINNYICFLFLHLYFSINSHIFMTIWLVFVLFSTPPGPIYFLMPISHKLLFLTFSKQL